MKNKKLRAVWILPNILMYLLLIGMIVFTVVNADGLQETNLLLIYFVMTILQALIAIIVSLRIRSWIKAGKM